MSRPKFEEIKTGNEFNQWFWLKEEMVEICKRSGLPVSGRKFDLRDRIMYALDHEGKVKPEPKKQKQRSKFNWAKSKLSLETRITDNVSFGPNFRRFMKSQIGNTFSCHSDFMDWVKSNTGKPLSEAVYKWNELEKRKEDPNFKRKIADNNMLAQYIRDFLEDNKNRTLKDAKNYWNLKKQLPTKNGFVRYESSDLKLK
ncbi:MAG: DUF6434 domain-containing protein [Bacteroidota bacterium]